MSSSTLKVPPWLQIALAIIGGGFLTNIFPFFQLTHDSSERQRISEIDRLTDRVEEYEYQLSNYRERVLELEKKLVLITASSNDLPFPRWASDRNGMAVFANDAFEDEFLLAIGVTREEFVFNDDVSVWTEEIRDLLRSDQIRVINRAAPITRTISFDNDERIWTVITWPWTVGDQIVGTNTSAMLIES